MSTFLWPAYQYALESPLFVLPFATIEDYVYTILLHSLLFLQTDTGFFSSLNQQIKGLRQQHNACLAPDGLLHGTGGLLIVY